MLLYRATIGSNLHGFARASSDYDYIEVFADTNGVEHKRHHHYRQTIVGNDDATQVTLNAFIKCASNGSSQHLDAMFAPKSDHDLFYAYRSNFRVGVSAMLHLYYTIPAIIRGNKFTPKLRRHAARILCNANSLYKNEGRYNPVLDDKELDFCLTLWHNDEVNTKALLLSELSSHSIIQLDE